MEMKLLEETAARADKNFCRDVVVLHCNHCLDNTFYYNKVLQSLFGSLVFLAIPYNNRSPGENFTYAVYHAVYDELCYHLKKNGSMTGHDATGLSEAVEDMFEMAIDDIVPLLLSGKKLLIVEDGGFHLPPLKKAERKYPFLSEVIVGVVEQTTLGTRRCMDGTGQFRYAYPCASVAKSDVKMYVESIFIGQRIVEELSLMLHSIDCFFTFRHILICGYGIVGRSVARALRGRIARIDIFDKDRKAGELAGKEGFKVYHHPDRKMFERDTVWIGCVGSGVFDEECLKSFLSGNGENLYLASGSSRNVEFSYMLCYLEGKEPPVEGLTLLNAHKMDYASLYEFSYNGRKKNIWIVAEGKPVNFYRQDGVSLTHSVMDLVFTEMLLLSLFLCTNPRLDVKLYLLGLSPELKAYINEENLIVRWFWLRQFELERSVWELLDPHPLGEQLRGFFSTPRPEGEETG